jgi:hypothetical protein
LGQWKERALNLDREWRRENAKTSSSSTTNTPKASGTTRNHWQSKTSHNQKKDDDAMEVDAISTNIETCTFCKKPGHNIKNCRVKNNSCFRCGKPGHRIFECTKKGSTSRKINFVKAEPKESADDTFDYITEKLNSLSEEDYAKVTGRFATGF